MHFKVQKGKNVFKRKKCNNLVTMKDYGVTVLERYMCRNMMTIVLLL